MRTAGDVLAPFAATDPTITDYQAAVAIAGLAKWHGLDRGSAIQAIRTRPQYAALSNDEAAELLTTTIAGLPDREQEASHE